MQPTSLAFQTAVQGSHHSVCLVNVIQKGQVVMQLPIVDGTVTADRTSAQMRSFTLTLGDPDGSLTPKDMTSLLAPFGSMCQIFRGVRISTVSAVVDLDNTAAAFNQGTNNGTTGDPATGHLILAWGSI
ncbi:MAG: hypothetical protein JWO67_6464 [Streptosporangiaceae bacterium]|nr:hypothetical protein [Streptosporangiaceae bacterium]